MADGENFTTPSVGIKDAKTFSIREEDIVQHLIVKYLNTLTESNKYYDIYNVLRALYSFVYPYVVPYTDIKQNIENNFTEVQSLLKELNEAKTDYDDEEYFNKLHEYLNFCDRIFQNISEVLGRAGFRKIPFKTISLIPNYYATVEEIYRKKYDIALSEKVGELEKKLFVDGAYVSPHEVIGDVDLDELATAIDEDENFEEVKKTIISMKNKIIEEFKKSGIDLTKSEEELTEKRLQELVGINKELERTIEDGKIEKQDSNEQQNKESKEQEINSQLFDLVSKIRNKMNTFSKPTTSKVKNNVKNEEMEIEEVDDIDIGELDADLDL